MFGKRKLKAEIVKLTYRVQDLEERLCPCESHAWKCIKTDWDFDRFGDSTTFYTYKCKRCGKQWKTWQPMKEDTDG